jgi:putative nucleotidyltransferase with HDIG domain
VTSRYTDELLDLSAQPAAAEQVLRLVSSPRSSASDLARVVETDPALAARVMRLANSPYYGAARRVSSTQHAIVMLGFDTVRGLAVSAAFSLLDGRGGVGPDGFWRHSVTTAAAASTIAKLVGASTTDAFSVGLLHDIGAVLLHRRDPVKYAEVMRAPTVSRMVTAELAAFGITHAQAGASALDAWGFPHAFVEAVALHEHGVELAEHAVGRILRVAEAIALEHAPMPGYPTPPDLDHLLESIRLRDCDFETITRDVDDQLERLADFLGLNA